MAAVRRGRRVMATWLCPTGLGCYEPWSWFSVIKLSFFWVTPMVGVKLFLFFFKKYKYLCQLRKKFLIQIYGAKKSRIAQICSVDSRLRVFFPFQLGLFSLLLKHLFSLPYQCCHTGILQVSEGMVQSETHLDIQGPIFKMYVLDCPVQVFWVKSHLSFCRNNSTDEQFIVAVSKSLKTQLIHVYLSAFVAVIC